MASQILDLTDEDDINFFADDLLPASDNSACCPPIASENSSCCPTVGRDAITTMSSPITTTTAASCGSESMCCFVGDDASFDFDPATISSLLDCDLSSDYDPPDVTPAATAATYQLPATSVNIGAQSQDELSQLLLNETINSRNWPQDSPDSVIPLDMDQDTRPGWMPWSCYTPDSGAQLPDGQPIQMMPPLMGYMGMDTLPTCAFLDSSIISRYQPMSSGDGQMGFFHGRTMMCADTGMGGMVAEGGGLGGFYGMDSTQRIYNSIDMQVMGHYKNLVDGCHSNPTALPTSDITPLDDSTLKVGRLSPEERKEKIHRYLKKRSERNFNKKIKYACRKTLADSRPRVRGRFAKNDEHGEGSTRPSSSHHEYFEEEEVVVVKEEEDMLNSSDIFAHINGVNSFNYNYTLESWI